MSKGIVWDLTTYFDEFNGSKMKAFKKDIQDGIGELVERSSSLDPLNENTREAWRQVVIDSEELYRKLSHLGSYVVCLCSADANNEDYLKEYAILDGTMAEASKISIHLKAGLKSASDEEFAAFLEMDGLSDISFYLEEIRRDAKKTMTADLETLAADLSVDGFSSWDRLYSTVSSKLQFDMHWPDGRVESTPISQCRSLMQDSDRQVRRSAFEHGRAAWKTVEDVCAAALNSIAGTRLVLNRRRGIEHYLDVSLHQSRISKETLDAMFQAIEECRPFIQEVGRAKADALGLKKLAWYDCEAPLPIPDQERYSWEECVEMTQKAFSRAYPALGDFFREALEKRWVESEPRPGKRPGAFCTGSALTEESRVYMTFNGSLSDISTLAHEVGHAFHSRQLQGMRPYLKKYPMTLAESASTFGEMLLAEGVLEDPASTDAQKLSVLTETINSCMSFMIDIPIRFQFEKSFYDERSGGAVGVSRLKELMTRAIENQFGDLIEEGTADDLFWASKMHFYLTGVSFYNYPYTFGYLLSRGLFEMFKREGEAFLPRYQDFLRLTGSDMAQNVARGTLGADLEGTEFWKKAIMGHEPELSRFKELAPKVLR